MRTVIERTLPVVNASRTPPTHLYHFSEEPDIVRFEPRPRPGQDGPPCVWAIDEWHAPMYYVPRDCPRACFWPDRGTSDDDRERWFGGIDARMVIAIESGWLDRVRTTTLYRYTLPSATFAAARDDDSGHFVSPDAVVPLRVEAMPDLLGALATAGVELRITPSLVELWRRVTASTLQFSGTRLRNAEGWPAAAEATRGIHEEHEKHEG